MASKLSTPKVRPSTTTQAASSTKRVPITKSTKLLLPSPKGASVPIRTSLDTPSESVFQAFDGGDEPQAAVLLRQKLYYDHWTILQTHIDAILAQSNNDLLKQLVDFVSHAHDSPSGVKSLFNELPTAALLTGINPTDHTQVYSHLVEHIKAAGHSSSTLLAANATSLKMAMNCMIQGLCDIPSEEDDANDSGLTNVSSIERVPKGAKAPLFSIERLSGWYRHRREISATPTGKLVVFIPEFEIFDPEVLSKLLAICCKRTSELPFVFIFGIATSIDCIHQMLSKATVCSLKIEKFQLHRSLDCINDLARMFQLDSKPGFRLGSWPYQQLLENYHLHDLSVSAFVRGVQYSVMAYYYGNPLSCFQSLLKESAIVNDQTDMSWVSDIHYLRLRMLPSFKTYVESIRTTQPRLAYDLLINDHLLLDHSIYLMSRVSVYQQRVRAAVNIVTGLQQSFESVYLKRPMCTLVKDLLRENLMDSDLLKTMENVHKNQPLSKVKATLEEIKRILLNFPEPDSSMAAPVECTDDTPEPVTPLGKSKSKRMLTKIETIDMLLERAIKFEKGNDEDMEEPVRDEDETMYLIKNGLKRVREQKMHERRSKVSTLLKPIEQGVLPSDRSVTSWTAAATLCIWDALRDMLHPYTSMPLHELFYFDDQGRSLSKVFNAQPRAVVQTALGHPDTYMPCDRCCDPSQTISSSLDDTSIAYTLYLECGRLINLYDWHTAFAYILQSKSACCTAVPDPLEIQVRFVKAVADLQHLGFIKPTARKTDHVVRLTWGTI
ncbi:hypothetical protein BASA50_010595 [Batrachochytrium salamandrivorans]|uniref:Origin recognition complex subunit 3 n=1 Tax=Batrachochytrium salamandrivorans TaxID=1357716 RepID=A0ABQ8EY28_9FUNG|nr:hypothetical protein BASA50_010595 [Batrachochytrium salamandrivorans]KAH9269283.1 hypothetical protein BASA83_008645 [Batrachochytrium salamandrivorans]